MLLDILVLLHGFIVVLTGFVVVLTGFVVVRAWMSMILHIFQRFLRDDGILLGVLGLWERVTHLLSMLQRDRLVQVLQLPRLRALSLEPHDLEDRINLLDHIDRDVADFFVVEVNVRILLLAAATQLLRLHLYTMGPLAMLEQLCVSVEALPAFGLLALIQLGLRVSAVVLSSVTARGEGPVAESTLEGPLSSVHSFVHLKVRLVLELFATHAFFT